MADAKTVAFIAHALPGRLRLRIPEKRGDNAYFTELADQLARCPGITSAVGTPRTGSLLIRHTATMDTSDLMAQAERLGLFTLTHPPTAPRRTLLQHARAGTTAVDQGLLAASGGFIDLPSALLITLLALAARQTAEGKVLIPAASLLWYALGLTSPRKSNDHAT